MRQRLVFLILLGAFAVFYPLRSPAPLVYTPGEGWHYESYGSSGAWRKDRAEDQLQVAQEAFDAGDHAMALRAGNYLLRKWPLSDYAPAAQFLVARCYELKGNDERAFKEYQKMFEQYPKSDKLKDALQQQYEIALRFLAGQRFRLWGYIPFFPNMEKTAGLFEKIVASAPYSDVAPDAQLKIGAAYEKKKAYPEAVDAYERAADRYYDRPKIAADALYNAGKVYTKQAATAEYDQGSAGQAIATFTDFMTLYPDDPRVPEVRDIILSLRNEQARGNFKIAEFYAKQKKWSGALIYYNEVVLRGPESPLAPIARERIDEIKQRQVAAAPQQTPQQ